MVKNIPEIDEVSQQTIKFFGGKKELIAFLNEIVKQGGKMLAAEALKHDWWHLDRLLKKDLTLQELVNYQEMLVVAKADETLCNRSINGFEEVAEERGEIVKKNRKFNDRALLDYLKANHPKYKKDSPEEDMPAIEIRRFDVPIKK